MGYDNNSNSEGSRKPNFAFSKRVKAGKRRTYFFDVRETRGNDYFVSITESKRRFNDDGYERHKIFIYKEDFNKFLQALEETTDYVKTELIPDFDYDSFNHDDDDDDGSYQFDDNSPSESTSTKDSSKNPDTESGADEESSNSVIDDAAKNGDNVESWKI